MFGERDTVFRTTGQYWPGARVSNPDADFPGNLARHVRQFDRNAVQKRISMLRPVTLFSGQRTDLALVDLMADLE